MKKILLSLCLFLSLSISSTWASDDKVKPVEISKGQIEDHNEVRPRTPVSIICTYNDGILYFTFLEDLGEMKIAVTHQFLGVVTTYKCDAMNGSAIVAASSENGIYLVEIVTESGEYYYGEYEL